MIEIWGNLWFVVLSFAENFKWLLCFASSAVVVFITLSNECVAMSDSGVIALLTCLSSVVVNTIEATTRTALKKLKQNKILNNKNHKVCRIAAEQFCQAQIVKYEL